MAALSALAGRPRRAPVPPGSPGPAFSSLGLRPRLPLGLSGSGVFSLAALSFLAGPFSPAAFSSGAGVGGCSGSGGSFFPPPHVPPPGAPPSAFQSGQRRHSPRREHQPGHPGRVVRRQSARGAFSGVGASWAGAPAGPASNKLGWGFSSGLTFNFSSAIRYLLF